MSSKILLRIGARLVTRVGGIEPGTFRLRALRPAQRCHNALAGASIHLCVPAVAPGQPNVGILDFGVCIAGFGFRILVVLVVLVAAPNAAVWISGVGFWTSYTGLDFAQD